VDLTLEQSWDLLRGAERAVLCTTNARGAIDAVPVCFAVVGTRVATPVERVKPKRTTALARRRNLERAAAATLLTDHWDAKDWARLWWVRARLLWRAPSEVGAEFHESCQAALRAKYSQYEGAQFVDVLVFDVTEIVGWSGSDAAAPGSDTAPPGESQSGGSDPLM